MIVCSCTAVCAVLSLRVLIAESLLHLLHVAALVISVLLRMQVEIQCCEHKEAPRLTIRLYSEF
jgi:hypothetical protein